MTINNLILASASPRRLELLKTVGIIPAQVVAANIDETPQKNESPHLYAKRVAMAKAVHVAAQHADAIVLAADTVVACGARILPKANDEKSARQCLKLLSGKRHRVYTAVVVQHNSTIKTKTVMTMVQCDRLSKQEVESYIASGEWQGKAGGYAIQGCAQAFISRINGSYSNVVGLPLRETMRLLKQVAVEVSSVQNGKIIP